MIPTKVVCDTNIVSYLMKGHTITREYWKHLQGKLLSIAFMIVGELYYGAEIAVWGIRKKEQLKRTLRQFLVIPYDHEIAHCYAAIAAEQEKKGEHISCADACIEACALRHNIPLITHTKLRFKKLS
jgi:tRNA(fMet)-specific endonuclease VapC